MSSLLSKCSCVCVCENAAAQLQQQISRHTYKHTSRAYTWFILELLCSTPLGGEVATPLLLWQGALQVKEEAACAVMELVHLLCHCLGRVGFTITQNRLEGRVCCKALDPSMILLSWCHLLPRGSGCCPVVHECCMRRLSCRHLPLQSTPDSFSSVVLGVGGDGRSTV
jgi:hypothetical protein